MRRAIWDTGAYAGYPQDPSLQMRWFLDRAASFRMQWIAAGRPDPAGDERMWGEWAADILLPAQSQRFRYQQRLADARALVGAPCTDTAMPGLPAPLPLPPPPPPPPPAAPADTTAPLVRVSGASSQRALPRGAIVLGVRCPDERCTTSAAAAVALPGRQRALKIVLGERAMAAGSTRRLRFVLSAGARSRLRAALRTRRSLRATVRITVRDAADNTIVHTRTVRLTR